MRKKLMRLFLTLFALLLTLALISCSSGSTDEPATDTGTDESAADTDTTTDDSVEAVAGKVGIVLPTKDEPRWVQDETRFQEALEAAGYEVEILFSQGDSAKERANVEDLITKGATVIIITPQDGTAAAAAAKLPKTLA